MDDRRWTTSAVSRSRRQFIREATGACLGTAFLPSHSRAAQPQRNRKAVIVTFGGGARDDETFMPGGHENIPHLLGELLPQATFFTQVVNRGILGHYVANASLATAPMRRSTISSRRRRSTRRSSSTSAKT